MPMLLFYKFLARCVAENFYLFKMCLLGIMWCKKQSNLPILNVAKCNLGS